MFVKKTAFALAGALMVFGVGAAHAETDTTVAQAAPLATLGAVPAKKMSVTQMKSVEGKAHIYFLVESKGVELPAKAEAATRAAAPTPKGGNFARSPSREATAFDFLN